MLRRTYSRAGASVASTSRAVTRTSPLALSISKLPSATSASRGASTNSIQSFWRRSAPSPAAATAFQSRCWIASSAST